MQGTVDARDRLGYHPSLVEDKWAYTKAYFGFKCHIGRTFPTEGRDLFDPRLIGGVLLREKKPSTRVSLLGLAADYFLYILSRDKL
jgi:hypothetical protein